MFLTVEVAIMHGGIFPCFCVGAAFHIYCVNFNRKEKNVLIPLCFITEPLMYTYYQHIPGGRANKALSDTERFVLQSYAMAIIVISQ